MTHTRRFYGHQGVVPPTGSGRRPADAAPEAIVEEVIEATVEGGSEVIIDGAIEVIVESDDAAPEAIDDAAPEVINDAAPEVIVEAVDAADAAPEVIVEEVIADAVVEQLVLPDATWKVSAIDAFAEEWGIDLPADGKKGAKLEAIGAWADALPAGEAV